MGHRSSQDQKHVDRFEKSADIETQLLTSQETLASVTQLIRLALTELTLLDVLQQIVDNICDTLGFHVGAVSLVNEAENTINMQSNKRNGYVIPNEWIEISKHSLDSSDIQAEVIRMRVPIQIAGWDKQGRFDPKIYHRFGHERLVRVWVPILGREKRAIGVLEAGYNTDIKPTIEPHKVEMLQEYVKHVALVIENAQLLERERARAAHFASNLDLLTHEIEHAYHALIGPNIVIASQTLENLLAGKLGDLSPIQCDRIGTARQQLITLQRRIKRLLFVKQVEEQRAWLRKENKSVRALVLESVWEARKWAREKGLKIHCDVKRITCIEQFDVEKVTWALDDILANAVKFTPRGGTIEVRAEEQEHTVTIAIRDSGIGIAPSYVERIFDKYFRAVPPPEGTWGGSGIGLHLAKRVIESHGGKITLESVLGEGTTFTILLPKHSI